MHRVESDPYTNLSRGIKITLPHAPSSPPPYTRSTQDATSNPEHKSMAPQTQHPEHKTLIPEYNHPPPPVPKHATLCPEYKARAQPIRGHLLLLHFARAAALLIDLQEPVFAEACRMPGTGSCPRRAVRWGISHGGILASRYTTFQLC